MDPSRNPNMTHMSPLSRDTTYKADVADVADVAYAACAAVEIYGEVVVSLVL